MKMKVKKMKMKMKKMKNYFVDVDGLDEDENIDH